MALVTFEPVQGLAQLQSELDRWFGKPAFDLGLSGGNVFPPINVFTDGEGLVVRAEVPGLRPDQLKLQIEAGRLTLSGERGATQATNGSYHRRERQSGTFSRTVQLPRDLDPERAGAEYRNGVLTVRIPKQAAAKPRQIEIKAA